MVHTLPIRKPIRLASVKPSSLSRVVDRERDRDGDLGLRSTPPPNLGEGVAGTILIRVTPPDGGDQQVKPGSLSSGSSPSDDVLVV